MSPAVREREARAAKAQAIAAVLLPMIEPLMTAAAPGRGEAQARLVTRMLRDLSTEARETAAAHAHRPPPSPHTWAVVVGLIANEYEFTTEEP